MLPGQSPADESKTDPLAMIFQVGLGESPQASVRLARSWRAYRKVVKGFWHESAITSLDQSMDRADKIVMEDEDLLQNFLLSHQQGLVLLTIHMGDYLHACLKILRLCSGRKVLILRKKSWSKAEQASFGKLDRIGHEMVTVRNGTGAGKSIIAALRQGAIVVMLYDLPPRWGETLPVNMFNRQLNWVMGPLQLSMLGKSCVLPFFTFETDAGWQCDLNPIRDYRHINQDRSLYLRSEMQALANIAERYIKRYATQWNHWHLMPEMVGKPEVTHGGQ